MDAVTKKRLVRGVLLMVLGVALLWLGSRSWLAEEEIHDGGCYTAECAGVGDEVCIQVVTPARNPETGEVVDYPTPCDVPEGWEVVAPKGVE